MPVVELLPPSFLAQMASYRLVSRQPACAAPGGTRRSRLKGGTVEFADYREYSPGDEPRRVDWKAYARLRRLYVKEYLDERQDNILFLIDTSASMDFGEADHKGQFALKLAAGLGSCVLSSQDGLAIFTTADGRQAQVLSPLQGRQALPRLLDFLAGLSFSGQADLAASLKTALPVLPQARRLYIFSDLFYPGGIDPLLRQAAAAGLEVNLLHILAPPERWPVGEGDWSYIDAESGARVEVTLTPAVLAAYHKRFEEYIRELDASCNRWGARRVALDSGEAATVTLRQTLVRAGILQPRG